MKLHDNTAFMGGRVISLATAKFFKTDGFIQLLGGGIRLARLQENPSLDSTQGFEKGLGDPTAAMRGSHRKVQDVPFIRRRAPRDEEANYLSFDLRDGHVISRGIPRRRLRGWRVRWPRWRRGRFRGQMDGPLLLRSVIAAPRVDHQVLPILDAQVDRVKQAVGHQWLRAVRDVVLVAQFVGDVLERLLQVLHLEWEERAGRRSPPSGTSGPCRHRFRPRDVGRDRVDDDVGLLRHFERLVAGVPAVVVVAVAEDDEGSAELVAG